MALDPFTVANVAELADPGHTYVFMEAIGPHVAGQGGAPAPLYVSCNSRFQVYMTSNRYVCEKWALLREENGAVRILNVAQGLHMCTGKTLLNMQSGRDADGATWRVLGDTGGPQKIVSEATGAFLGIAKAPDGTPMVTTLPASDPFTSWRLIPSSPSIYLMHNHLALSCTKVCDVPTLATCRMNHERFELEQAPGGEGLYFISSVAFNFRIGISPEGRAYCTKARSEKEIMVLDREVRSIGGVTVLSRATGLYLAVNSQGNLYGEKDCTPETWWAIVAAGPNREPKCGKVAFQATEISEGFLSAEREALKVKPTATIWNLKRAKLGFTFILELADIPGAVLALDTRTMSLVCKVQPSGSYCSEWALQDNDNRIVFRSVQNMALSLGVGTDGSISCQGYPGASWTLVYMDKPLSVSGTLPDNPPNFIQQKRQDIGRPCNLPQHSQQISPATSPLMPRQPQPAVIPLLGENAVAISRPIAKSAAQFSYYTGDSTPMSLSQDRGISPRSINEPQRQKSPKPDPTIMSSPRAAKIAGAKSPTIGKQLQTLANSGVATPVDLVEHSTVAPSPVFYNGPTTQVVVSERDKGSTLVAPMTAQEEKKSKKKIGGIFKIHKTGKQCLLCQRQKRGSEVFIHASGKEHAVCCDLCAKQVLTQNLPCPKCRQQIISHYVKK